ncbi:MAG: hypothetical protein ACOYA8_00795 [Clostridium sp.]
MISRKDVMPVNFLKKEKFTGSDSGMRYRMEKTERDGESGGETVLTVTAWPEPYGYDATPEEQKIQKEFPFSEDGIERGVSWLNDVHNSVAQGELSGSRRDESDGNAEGGIRERANDSELEKIF